MSGNQQLNAKGSKQLSWIRIGFGIGVSVSLVGYLGITGLLFALEKFNISEEQLTIYTSLFYGIIFFAAFGGFRAETRRHRALMSMKPYEEDPPPRTTPFREKMKRVRSVSWIVFSVISIGWITPALVIHWMEPRHTVRAVVLCASLLGAAAGVGFVFKRGYDIHPPYEHLLFFMGLCLGVYLGNSFGVGVWS